MRVPLHFLCSIFLIAINMMMAGCTQSYQKNLSSHSLPKEQMHISQDSAGVYVYCELSDCLSRTHKILRVSLDQAITSIPETISDERSSGALAPIKESKFDIQPETVNKSLKKNKTNRAANKKRIHKKKVVKPKCLTKP